MVMLKKKSKEEQLKLLNISKKFFTERIQDLTHILENIDQNISDLESETKSK
jgi:hypothetical protein